MSESERGAAEAPAQPPREAEAAAAPDLRLLPVLVGLWLGIAVALVWQPESALRVTVGASAVLIGAMAGLWWFRLERPLSPGLLSGAGDAAGVRPLSGRVLASVLLLAAFLVGLALGALHVRQMSPALIQRIVADSAVVELVGTVTGDPRAHVQQRAGRQSDPTWTAEVLVHELTARSRAYRTRLPVVLRGEQVEALAYGSVVQLTGRAEAPWNPERSAMSVRVLGPVTVRAPPGALASATNSVRAAFQAAVAGLPQDAGALLLGLAVGDESRVSPDLDEAMVRAGLAHLTAVSGSNTSLVVGLALGAVTALGLGWRLRVASALVVLAAYVLLVRPQPSVLRAAAMGLVALIALTAGGRRRGPPALLTAAIVLLAWEPSFALSWGFALSVAATAGLLLLGPGVAERLARWPPTARVPDPVRAALAVACAAHLATLPLAVAMGNGASLVALPANVVVTPFVPFATVVGLAAAMVAPLAPPVAVVLAWVAAPATTVIAWVAHHGSALPLSVLAMPDGWTGALLIGCVLVGGWALARRRVRPWRDRRLVALTVVASLVIGSTVRLRDARWPPPDWVMLACDVGQGDGLLLRARGSDKAVLVDVGPTGSRVAECARDAGIAELTVVLTHFHADHVDGLADVLDSLRVTSVLTTSTPDPLPAARQVVALTGDAQVPLRTLHAGEQFSAAGVPLSVLWPVRRMSDPNNASVVLVAAIPTGARPVTALLTGDVEPEAQAALIGRGVPQVDVVKVPHHGSSHQDARFATTARARIALVSVGADNDYGHPNAGTLADYVAAGAVVGRTDTQGALAVVPGPQGPRLITARDPG